MNEKAKRIAYINGSDQRVAKWSQSRREAFQEAVRSMTGNQPREQREEIMFEKYKFLSDNKKIITGEKVIAEHCEQKETRELVDRANNYDTLKELLTQAIRCIQYYIPQNDIDSIKASDHYGKLVKYMEYMEEI